MKIIDLTHVISPGMPCYPGTEPPLFSSACTLESHGFAEKKITLYSHIGTHMDAPAHVFDQARTLDQFDINHFVGRAVTLDLTRSGKSIIAIDDLQPYRSSIEGKDFVLLHTGWSTFWGSEAYFKHYPLLSMEAAEWLARYHLKGLGMDMISIDELESPDLPIHRIFLKRNTVMIENLAHLEELRNTAFTFFCLPLKIDCADGAPVRAVAVIEES